MVLRYKAGQQRCLGKLMCSGHTYENIKKLSLKNVIETTLFNAKNGVIATRFPMGLSEGINFSGKLLAFCSVTSRAKVSMATSKRASGAWTVEQRRKPLGNPQLQYSYNGYVPTNYPTNAAMLILFT